MRKAAISCAIVASLAATSASAELNLRHAAIDHLPNGLTVILLEEHSFPLVSVQTLYKSGSAAEVTGKTGLAHFLEHLAFRGSERFPNARATELIYDSGGEWHGYTAMDQTTYFATMPKDGLDLLLQIEADRMARTVIDPGSIEAEKGAVITELHSYENDPGSVLQEAVIRTAIQAHPYGAPMAGYVGDVVNLTTDDARAYYASHYGPENAVLAIVGDFDQVNARALVSKRFADVPRRPVARASFTSELPQSGERRTLMRGRVDRQFFLIAFRGPAASAADFPVFLVLQEILSGGSGLNLRQSDWGGTQARKGSLLFGTASDVATWLPPTRDPFLFTISGSIPANADASALERNLRARLALLRRHAPSKQRLEAAKAAVRRELAGDVETTEDAAHQLAFFEGIGALESLLDMSHRIATVTPADVRRVASSYLVPGRSTIGWMTPGKFVGTPVAIGNPQPAPNRPGTTTLSPRVSWPQLRHLSGGLPAIVQANSLSQTVTVELLVSALMKEGEQPADLPGLDAVIRSGTPDEVTFLVRQTAAVAQQGKATIRPPSQDPATRLQQLIASQMPTPTGKIPQPLVVIVSGNIDPEKTFGLLERQFGHASPATLVKSQPTVRSDNAKLVRERIQKPLSQGALGYVVEGPPPGTREAFVWRMLLYVLSHDYSGRLGRSAIGEKGLVYHIFSALRTDGRRSWVTLSTGVDPDRADAMEAELQVELARLVSEPPTMSELDAARNHLLGRDITKAQSNQEIAAKLAHEFVETNGLRSHEQLRAQLETITPQDLAAAARSFVNGTIMRVDVEPHAP